MWVMMVVERCIKCWERKKYTRCSLSATQSLTESSKNTVCAADASRSAKCS